MSSSKNLKFCIQRSTVQQSHAKCEHAASLRPNFSAIIANQTELFWYISAFLTGRMYNMVTAVLSFAIISAVHAKILRAVEKQNHVSNDICEYDIDLKRNTIRAKCQGEPLGVSVYASSASVTTTQTKEPNECKAAKVTKFKSDVHTAKAPFPEWNDVLNSTGLLGVMRQRLNEQKSAITNISSLLSRGDNDLRSDLEALRGLASDDSSVRESIIATMRNQYNFMRTAILAHNAELSQVLSLLDSLLTMTARTLHHTRHSQHSLQQQLAHVNRTVLAMRSTLSSSLRKRHKDRASRDKDQCPRVVSALGSGESWRVPWHHGVVMTDSAGNSERIWIMAAEDGTDQLLQYDSSIDIQYRLVSRYYSLPFYCEGTGHVVFRNALFCHKAGTRTVAKYNLKRMEVSAEVQLPSAGVANTFPYQFGLNSDIDLAVDELGLWVTYSTKESAGKMVISKLNPRSLVIEKTWLTSFPKKLVGNSFMVCGVLYATNSYEDTPTFVRYTYDTGNQHEAIHDAGNLVFNNAVVFNSSKQASSVMLDYNAKEHKLYSWSNSQIQTFPVYFKKDGK